MSRERESRQKKEEKGRAKDKNKYSCAIVATPLSSSREKQEKPFSFF
jgi:hypothetical protein